MNTKILGIKRMLTKNSPTILTGMAVTGLLSTVILSVKATPKALALLEDATEYKNKDVKTFDDCIPLTKIEVIKETWKCYIPAIITGSISIVCIIGANTVNLRRNAALAGLYSISETALKEYKTKVVETIGKEKEKEIRDDIKKDKISKHPVNDDTIIITGDGQNLCYDVFSGRYFKSDIESIRATINKLNRSMLNENFISVNDIYDALNMPQIKMGDTLGWRVYDGLLEPDFGSQLTDRGVPCLVLDFNTEPTLMNWDIH